MAEAAPSRRWTVAEYLAREQAADEKHMLWDGELFAMAGGSRVHNRLVAAILGELRPQLLGRGCAAYASDQRIAMADRPRYVYPDATIVCAPVETAADDAESITNPRVVFEVLSDSTEAFDRGDKFVGYREIAALTDYVLVSQRAARIEHFARQADGSWLLRTYEAGSTVVLGSVGISLSVDALYTDVFDVAAG